MQTTEDKAVIEHFGDEWQTFTHDDAQSAQDLTRFFNDYFANFPWNELPPAAVGADVGCGTGRIARFVAPRVGKLYCCDPSAALEVARRALADLPQCEFVRATADALPFDEKSLDFAYCIGVLHHVSDTEGSLRAIVSKLRPGAPFLLYLYYAMENRPAWYRALWLLSDVPRRIISRAPFFIRRAAAEVLAVLVYWPLARFARIVEALGGNANALPLSWYRRKRLYFMRSDALDRFGTRVEKRYTRTKMQELMQAAGLEAIVFNDHPPFWTAVGRRRAI